MSSDAPVDPVLLAFQGSAQAAARSPDLDAAASGVLTIVSQEIGASLATVFLVDDEGRLTLLASHGAIDSGAHEAEVRDRGDHLVHWAIEARAATVGRYGSNEDEPVTAVATPMIVADEGLERVVGILSVGATDEALLQPATKALLAAAADVLAIAVDRARLASLVEARADWFERLSQTDPLTGLANARTLSRVLDLEIARAGRQAGEVSVAIFDVDGLGAINAEQGRAAGDDVLRRVAEIVATSVRLVDTVARTGADEFVVVAPGSAGASVAQRVADRVAGGTDGIRATVSAGIARYPADGTTADELISTARSAMETARPA